MKESEFPENPASNNFSDFVLYDRAFEKEFVLTHVLDHELSHRLFEYFPETEKESFRKAGQWKEDPKKKGRYLPTRPQSAFMRKNDMLSPDEDFAESITAFIHQPQKLKKITPSVYDWMKKHIAPRLKNGGSK